MLLEQLLNGQAVGPRLGQNQPRRADRFVAGPVKQQAVNGMAVELVGFQPALLRRRVLELPLNAIDLIAKRESGFHQGPRIG